MLNIRKTKMNSDEEEKSIEKKLEEAISKAEKTKTEEPDCDICNDEMTPAEELSCRIANHLAFAAAERFADIADIMGMEAAKKFIMRLECAEAETAVSMLQVLFLSHGMVHAAEELDILEHCKEFDSDAYVMFIDGLFDTDIFDWYSIENLFDEFRKEDSEKQCGQEVVIWQRL